jgi:quercetin dioxygenase-like cupin family protein
VASVSSSAAANVDNNKLALTYAEQPLQLVRGLNLASATRGVLLAGGDLVENGTGPAQFDGAAVTIALGPATRLFVRGGADIVLLSGWMKVRGAAVVTTASLKIALEAGDGGATVVIHAAPGVTEVFAEDGEAVLTFAARSHKLPREQFAVGGAGKPPRIAARAPAAFLAAMPPGFRDTLAALPASAAVAPKIARPAIYAELAPWLSEQPALRQQIARRFAPPRHR